MVNELAKEVIKLHGKLKGQRTNWDAHWQEIANFIVPNKDDVYIKQNNFGGEKKNNKGSLFDATAIHANEMLASALHGMLTSPTALWFELTTGNPTLDKQDDVRFWLQHAARRMHQVLNNSNFQTEVHEVFLDLCSFGTASMRIESDKDLIVRFHSRPIFELYIKENSKGIVDTVSREYVLDGRQILQEFGEKPFTEDELMKLKKDKMQEWNIIHLVRPRKDIEHGVKRARNKPFSSIHVLTKMGIVLKESGFEEFPYVIPRWSKVSGETYGRSPGMKALPDIKMINEIMKTTIIAAQKIVDPPLQVPDDGVLLPLRTTPGSLNYYRAGTADRIVPIETKGRVDLGFQLMEQVKLQIRQAYFQDQLQLREGPQKTATEVLQLTEENLRIMSPQLGRFHFEFLKPFIDRIFGVMFRAGELAEEEIPEILENRNIEVQFSSAIARAQRTTEVDNLNRAMGSIGPLAEMMPQIMDKIDGDEIVDFVANRFNLPQELIVSDEKVAQAREQRAEQEQAAAQQEQQLAQAEMIQKAGPTLAPKEG